MAQVPFAGAFAAISRVTSPITQRLGRRGALVVRYVAIVVIALFAFTLALQATFPYERMKDKIIEGLSAQYDVTIGGVERGWKPGRVYFKAVTLRTRVTKPDETATTFFVEKLEVDLGLLSLIGMNISVDLDAKVGAGRIKGNITLPKFGKAGVKVDLAGTDLPGTSLPLRSALGLPMTGKLDFAVDLDLPVSKNKMGRTSTDWTKADGTIDLSCPTGCTLGDGHTKLKPLLKNRTNQVMVGDGIDFGEVHISTLDVHAVFTAAVGDPDAHSSSYKPGKFEVTKFNITSPDGELHVDYLMTMAPTLDDSVVAGCLRFKASDNLLKKEETKKTYAAISTTGAELRSDGLFHIKLSDRFKDMKRLNAECGPNSAASKIGNGEDFSPHPGGGPRPQINTMPTPALRTGSAMPPPMPEPPPPPPPSPSNTATPTPPPGSAAGAPAGAAGAAFGSGSGSAPPLPEGNAAGAGSAPGSAEPQPDRRSP
ncbi:MAG TPA: type II secretion system protein GspN [Kofleriaceae bacterium]|nr:type II secretion system protein GspN [Kofleriaceae bacterium]